MENQRARLSLDLTTGESITYEYEMDGISRVIIENGKFYAYNDQGKELVSVGLRRIKSATAELLHADRDESKENDTLKDLIDKSIKKVDEALDTIYYLRKDLVDIRSARQQKE